MGQFIQSPTHSTTSNVVRPSHSDQNDFDAYMASGLIVTINARVATKEATSVAEEVGARRADVPLLLFAFDRGIQWQD